MTWPTTETATEHAGKWAVVRWAKTTPIYSDMDFDIVSLHDTEADATAARPGNLIQVVYTVESCPFQRPLSRDEIRLENGKHLLAEGAEYRRRKNAD